MKSLFRPIYITSLIRVLIEENHQLVPVIFDFSKNSAVVMGTVDGLYLISTRLIEKFRKYIVFFKGENGYNIGFLMFSTRLFQKK